MTKLNQPKATTMTTKPGGITKPAGKPAPKPAPSREDAEVATQFEEQDADTLVDHSTAPTLDSAVEPERAPVPASNESTEQLPALLSGATIDDDDDGFAGLDQEIGFGSFEMLKLDKTEFSCGEHTWSARFDEETKKGGVKVNLTQARRKFLVKARAPRDDNDQVPLVYSYDGKTSTNGEDLADIIAKWRAEGHMTSGKPVVSRYWELAAQIIWEGHPLHGELVLASVPPASVSRLAGYKKKLATKGLKLQQAVTLLTIGKKIAPKNKPSATFYPMDFRLLGRFQAAAAE